MPRQKHKGLTILSIASIPLILVLGNSMLIPVLPTMKSQLAISQFQSSLVISVFSVAAATTIPILGFFSDRFSRKAVVIPALTLYGLGGLLAGFSVIFFKEKAYLWILAGRVMQGIGAAGTTSMAMALSGDLFKGGEQSKVLGIVEASNGFGKVISPILGSLFALITWYTVFFAFPIFCLLSILLTIFFVKERKKKEKPPTPKQYLRGLWAIFKEEGTWLVIAYFTGGICLFTLFGISFYISEILEKNYQIDGLIKGAILAIPLLFMTSTSFITGSKIKKDLKKMKRYIVFGTLLMTISFSSLIFFEKLIPFFAVLVISSIGTGLVLPCINSLITDSVTMERRGFVTSLYGSVRFLGVAIGTPVYSMMMDWSRTGMFLISGGLAFAAGILCLLFIKTKNQFSGKNDGKGDVDTLFEKLQFS